MRSDEAGFYHNNCLVAAAREIGKRVGVAIVRYDFSEPQQGKDVCDHIICPLKSSIHKYCNEGYDVLNSDDMYAAIKKYPVKGTTASVAEVDESKKSIKVNKIDKFGSYHNFEFDGEEIKVWKAFGIGEGKSLKESSVVINHQQSTGLRVYKEFTEISSRLQRKVEPAEDEDASEKGSIFECMEENCNYVFSTFSDLEMHMDLGQHSRFVNNESVYDSLRREWANTYSTLTINVQKAATTKKSTMQLRSGESDLPMGWAVSKARTGSVRFSTKVGQYLAAKFNCGQKSGKKCDTVQVATDMRKAKIKQGKDSSLEKSR